MGKNITKGVCVYVSPYGSKKIHNTFKFEDLNFQAERKKMSNQHQKPFSLNYNDLTDGCKIPHLKCNIF